MLPTIKKLSFEDEVETKYRVINNNSINNISFDSQCYYISFVILQKLYIMCVGYLHQLCPHSCSAEAWCVILQPCERSVLSLHNLVRGR